MGGKKSNKGSGEALILTSMAGIIGSFIIDIMKLSHYDETYYYFQGSWLRHCLVIHIVLWPIFIALLVFTIIFFCNNEEDLGFYTVVILDVINIAYFIILGFIIYKPKTNFDFEEMFTKNFNESIFTPEAMISMKKKNSISLEFLYNNGSTFIEKAASYQSIAHEVMFYLCALLMIAAPFVPCILCF